MKKKNNILKQVLALGLTVLMLFSLFPSEMLLRGYAVSNNPVEDSLYAYMAQVILNYNYDGVALIDNTTLPNMRLKRYLDPTISSVSRPIADELNNNTAFIAGVAAWKFGTFTPTDILSAEEEEIGYYQSIILNILNTAVEDSFIPSALEDFSSDVGDALDLIGKEKIKGLEELSEVNLWDSPLSEETALEIYNQLEVKKFKVNSRFKNYGDLTGIISDGITVQKVIEKFYADAAIANLSENIKAVINELYNTCPTSKIELKAALREVKEVANSTLDRIGIDIGYGLWEVLKNSLEDFLSDLWKQALETVVGDLAAGVLIGQLIGKLVCNMMLSTDQIIEQWYKLNALVQFEDVMYSTIQSLSNKFRNAPVEENALNLISGIQILANMYEDDYKMSEELGEYVYEKGLWNHIKHGFQKLFNIYDGSDIENYHSDLNYLKGALKDLREITQESFYYKWLYIDKNQSFDFEWDENGNITKVISVKCPTDVDVYDDNGNLIVSIVNNEIVHLALNTYVEISNSEKEIYLENSDCYCVSITGTNSGMMNYFIYEVEDSIVTRTVQYNNVPLADGTVYSSQVTFEKNEPHEDYDLTCDDGSVIEATYDSLPPVESNVVDVIVAEEIFNGFSTELIDKVADTMFNMRPSVDISSYLITTDDIMGLFSAIQKYYPSEYSIMSKTDFSYKAIVSPSKGIVTGFRFYYDSDVNLTVYQKRVRDLQIEIDKIVAMTEGMSDFEKTLFVHDYIVLNCEYDYDLLNMLNNQNGRLDGEIRSERYTEYSVLVNGTGICGSYALAYRAVLNAAGVECLYLSSVEMNHAWNLVKINGSWYHCDLTWDDTGYGNDYHYGIAERTYFLRTDNEIMSLNHRTWTPGQYKAISGAFSNMPRYDDYKQKYDNGSWYYLRGGKLFSSDIYGKNEEEIVEVSASALEVADGEIYYSTGRNILHYDNDAHKGNYVYVLPRAKCGDEASKASIRNFYIDDENVTIYIKGVFNGINTTTKYYDTLNEEQYSGITGITLSKSELTLDVFEYRYLTARVLSEGVLPIIDVVWSSSDSTIATVDETGKITGANVGSATIKAEACGFTAECIVNVTGDGLSGMCGDDAAWSINDDKVLTISGTGSITTHSWAKKIKGVIIEEGITEICDYAFEKNNAEFISLPDSLMTIGGHAFSQTLIDNIQIPKNVNSIGGYAFYGCSQLLSINVSEENEWFASIEGVMYNKNITSILAYPDGRKTDRFIIPASVTSIDCAFDRYSPVGCLVIPDNLEGDISSYELCNLRYVNAFEAGKDCVSYSTKDGVLYNKDVSEIINYPAGRKCDAFVLPDTVTLIDDYAFSWAPFKTLVINNNVESNELFRSGFVKGDVERYIIRGNLTPSPWAQNYSSHNNNGYTKKFPYNAVYCYSTSDVSNYFNQSVLHYIDEEPHEHEYYFFYHIEKTPVNDGIDHYECCCGNSSDVIYHNYEFVNNTASCTEPGLIGQTCSVCGDTKTENTPPLGHNWIETSRTPGNCITPSVVTYTCSRCNDTKDEIADSETGHNYKSTVYQPTCTEYGYTEDRCEICGETVAYDFTSPLGHKLTVSRTTENCSAHGSYVYTCSRCDYTEKVAIDTTDLETETVRTEPTCTLAGSEKDICTLCGATVSTRIIPAIGHVFEEEFTVDVPATCTAEGSKSKHCKNCDVSILTESISAKGHDYGSWVNFNENQHQRVCANDSTHIEKADHTWNTGVITKAATCKETGTRTYTCTTCNATKNETISKNAANHASYGTALKNKVDANCTAKGYTGDTVCNGCGTVITKGHETAALGHTAPNGSGNCDRCGTHLKDVDSGNSKPAGACKYCGQVHTGPFGWLIKFFHSILALFGARK